MGSLTPPFLLLWASVTAATWPCPPESVFTQPRGNFSLGPFSTGRQSVECHYVWSAGAQGLTLRFLSFDLGGGWRCDDDDATVRIYDGSTRLAPMLALFSCGEAWSVASSTGAMLLTFAAPQRASGAGFAVVWEPSTGVCGNGICEPGVHDEYDRCSADCQRELPKFEEQYTDRKWCERFDTMTATASSGQSMEVEYTAAHFGTKVPETGLSLSIASVTPENACSTILSVTHGGSGGPSGAGWGKRFAALASIYSCHFLDKALHAENAGASLLVVMYDGSPLFYMAAADYRQRQARSLDIPSLLIGQAGSSFLLEHLSEGVQLQLGANQRCSGAKLLTAPSGALQSTPVGVKYCSWQDCMWHISLPEDDIIILSFSRLSLECVVGASGAFDYVKVYNGATPQSDELASFHCNSFSTLVSTGPNMLIHFHSDELYNFNGFAANYVSGEALCSPISDCGECTTNTWCSWCRSSERCVPNAGPKALCSDGNGWPLDATCCPAGRAGADCERCAANHYGATCTACDCSTVGGVCGDGLQGDGVCTCKPGFSGATCDVCKQGYWGAECSPCNCSGSSYCDEGLSGTGCVCNANHFGPSCEACTCVGDEICADGAAGDGSCSCPPFYTGPGCSECTAGRWGAQCNQCDCPALSKCDEGISGTGQCLCSGPSCETDASLKFLKLIVAKTLTDPAPSPQDRFALVSAPAFVPADISGTTTYELAAPSYVEALDIAFAVSHWNAHAKVHLQRPGEQSLSLLCAFDVSPSTSVDQPVQTLNSGVLAALNNAPGANLPTGYDALLRSCRFNLGIGSNVIQVSTTSPSGAQTGSYSLRVERALSDECRLSELNFALLDPECAVPLGCTEGGSGPCSLPSACQYKSVPTQRPSFNPNVSQYYLAIEESATSVAITAKSSHGSRCAGKYSTFFDTEGKYSRNCQASATLSYVSGDYVWPASSDAVEHVSLPPLGRSNGALVVTSESGRGKCTYNITISRGMRSDAALSSLTLELFGSGQQHPLGVQLPNASEAVDGVITWALPALEFWVDSITFQPSTNSAAQLQIICPPEVTCNSRRRLDAAAEQRHRSRQLLSVTFLPVGQTEITVVVTAEDLTSQLTYKLILTRPPSNLCKLDQIWLFRSAGPSCTAAACNGQLLQSWGPGVSVDTFEHTVTEVVYVQLKAEAVHSGISLEVNTAGGPWSSLEQSALTDEIALSVHRTYINLRATAEDGSKCLYSVLIDRPSSTLLASVNAQIIIRNSDSSFENSEVVLGRVVPVVTPSSYAGNDIACTASSCMDVLLGVGETSVQITAVGSESSTTFSHDAPYSSTWVVPRDGSSAAQQSKYVLYVEVSTLLSWIVLKLNTNGILSEHYIFIKREASPDATLKSLSIQGGRVEASAADGSQYSIAMHDNTNVLLVKATPSYPAATVTIAGLQSPAAFKFTSEMLKSIVSLHVIVVSEDSEHVTNITLLVRCVACDNLKSDMEAYGASVWLILMLLTTALLLCGLALAVCIKMHRMRNHRRQAFHEAYAGARQGIENPERILAVMEPFLLDVKAGDRCLSDESCAICLGDLTSDENLNMLPYACTQFSHATLHLVCSAFRGSQPTVQQ